MVMNYCFQKKIFHSSGRKLDGIKMIRNRVLNGGSCSTVKLVMLDSGNREHYVA